MRRFSQRVTVGLLLAMACLASPTWAAETIVYQKIVNKEWIIPFVTNRVGPVTVRARWTPKARGLYLLDIAHYTDPNDLYSYDQWVTISSESSTAPPPGDWAGAISEGKVGDWKVIFRASNAGKVGLVTITVTAETD